MRSSVAVFSILVLWAGVAFGQTALAPEAGPNAIDNLRQMAAHVGAVAPSVRVPKPEAVPLPRPAPSPEERALYRLRLILSHGGAVPAEDKDFVGEWFPRFYAQHQIGRAPTRGERSTILGWYPNMRDGRDWVVTGRTSDDYNCISWSLGVTSRWIWPGYDPEVFDRLYLKYGYVRLSPGESTEDADIALWADANGNATHASRRIIGEYWESKLGHSLRIIHHLDDLAGGGDAYGHVLKYYRKATPDELRERGILVRTANEEDARDARSMKDSASDLAVSGDMGSPSSASPNPTGD